MRDSHYKVTQSRAKQPRTRKAFFFIVVSLLLLTYVLSNLTLWSKAIEIQEKRISESFKSSTLEFMLSQIKQDDIEEFSKIAANYAMYSLNNHSIKNPVKEDATNPYSNINQSIHALLANGEAGKDYFMGEKSELKYTEAEVASYTFKGFFNTLNMTLQKSGLRLDSYSFYEFSLNQSDYTTLNFSFVVEVRASDKYHLASLSRTFKLNFELSIDGFVDPAIAREMQSTDFGEQIVEKQIFLDLEEYPDPKSLQITEGGSGFGQGWFYGPVLDLGLGQSMPSKDPLELSSWVLKGTESEITGFANYNLFGAYIITDKANVADLATNFDKPVFLNPTPTLTGCDTKSTDPQRCILFVSRYSVEDINKKPTLGSSSEALTYNIENLKDCAICGYYIPDPEGPSYFQRLLENSFDKKDSKYGLATFLLWDGIEAEGKLSDLSRLDYEFFNGEDGKTIRGMPGSKYAAMCAQKGAYVGQFKLSDTALEKYVSENWESTHIYCEGDQWSSCEGN